MIHSQSENTDRHMVDSKEVSRKNDLIFKPGRDSLQ